MRYRVYFSGQSPFEFYAGEFDVLSQRRLRAWGYPRQGSGPQSSVDLCFAADMARIDDDHGRQAWPPLPPSRDQDRQPLRPLRHVENWLNPPGEPRPFA